MLKTYLHKGMLEAGCDEAGRGCLAGPVVSAAVILPHDFSHPGLNDSKKLTESKRNEMRRLIESEAICYGTGTADPLEIDSINILRASILAMHRAILKLSTVPQHLLIDGNRFEPFPGIPHTTIVKGDSKFMSIAAASILAKTSRDDYMRAAHVDFPLYGWDQNKGYPTTKHRRAIMDHGTTVHHRKSFSLLPRQYILKFK